MRDAVPMTEARAERDLFADAELVIFDFDGVIADSEPISLETLGEALARAGIDLPPEEVRERFLGTSLATITAFVEARAPRSTDGFAAGWQAALFARFRADLRPVAHVEDLLDRLDARGIPFCIASSGTFERIGVALEAMGLEARFPHVFSAEEVTRGKPAPDLFLHAAGRLGVAHARCLVIEDAPFGVRAAKAAGMRCIGFVGGGHLAGMSARHAALLRREGAEAILTAFADATPTDGGKSAGR